MGGPWPGSRCTKGRHDVDDKAGPVIEPMRMVSRNETLEGMLDARALHELDDVLAPGEDPVDVRWQVTGMRSAEGRPMLVVAVEGSIPLTCQRCLERMAWPLEQDTHIVLASDEAELAELDGSLDDEVMLGTSRVTAGRLVADELMLSLPFAPLHEPPCR